MATDCEPMQHQDSDATQGARVLPPRPNTAPVIRLPSGRIRQETNRPATASATRRVTFEKEQNASVEAFAAWQVSPRRSVRPAVCGLVGLVPCAPGWLQPPPSRPASANISECRRRLMEEVKAARVSRASSPGSQAREVQKTKAEESKAVEKHVSSPSVANVATSEIPAHKRELVRQFDPDADFSDECHVVYKHLATRYCTEDLSNVIHADTQALRTGHDAIAFFAKYGNQSDIKVLYAVSDKSGRHNVDYYDLVIVDEKKRGNDFFMISATGVVRVCPGHLSEHMSLVDWRRESLFCSMLRRNLFFRRYWEAKIMQIWKLSARYEAYASTRAMLCKRLLFAKPAYAEALQRIDTVIRGIYVPAQCPYFEAGSRAVDMESFVSVQKGRTAVSMLESQLADARAEMDTLAEAVSAGARVEEDVRPPPKKAPRFLHVKRQQRIRERHKKQLRLMNVSLFGNFICLVDVMLQSALVKFVLGRAAELFETLRRPVRLFSLQAVLDEDSSVSFEPKLKEIQVTLQDLFDYFLKVVELVNPLSSSRKCLRYVNLSDPACAATVLKSNATYQNMCTEIHQKIEVDMVKVERYAEQHYRPCQDIHRFLLNHCIEAEDITLLSEHMMTMGRFEKDLEKLRPHQVCGCLLLESRTLRATLAPGLEEAFSATKTAYRDVMRERSEAAIESVGHAVRELQPRPTKLEHMFDFIETVRRVESQQDKLLAARALAEEMYAALRQYRVRVELEDEIRREKLHNITSNLTITALPAALLFLTESSERNFDEIERRLKVLEADMVSVSQSLQTNLSLRLPETPKAIQPILEGLDEMHARLDESTRSAEYLNHGLHLLSRAANPLVGVARNLSDECEERRIVWQLAKQVIEKIMHWSSQRLFEHLDLSLVEQLSADMEHFSESFASLASRASQLPAAVELKEILEHWHQKLPHLRHLGNPAVDAATRRLEYRQVCSDIVFEYLTVGDLDQMGFFGDEMLLKHHAAVSAQADAAGASAGSAGCAGAEESPVGFGLGEAAEAAEPG